MKRFKILKTNIKNLNNDHFECTTPIGSHSKVFNETFRCIMFDGLKVELVSNSKYILGEIHG